MLCNCKNSRHKTFRALYEDHNFDIVCLMPTNIYGISNFDKFSAHVIHMINKIHEAKIKKKNL